MIAQTYCGDEYNGGFRDIRCCPEEGPCPSCLRAHIAKLESALATAEDAYAESLEAHRTTEAEGGALTQANNEIDRLLAREKELESLLIAQDKDALVWQARVRELEAQAAAQAGGVVVPELTGVPVLREEFADNGEHSHWNLFDSGTGELLWTEATEEEWHKHHRRPVPASRVLGEASDLEHDIEFLREISENMAAYRERNDWAAMDMAQQMVSDWRDELQEKLDALRAAKEGA